MDFELALVTLLILFVLNVVFLLPMAVGEKIMPSDNPAIRTYFVYVGSSTYHPADLNSLLNESLSYWKETDHVNFKYVQDSQDATFTIRWIPETDEPYSAYTVNKRTIEIGLGDSKCNGVWHAYDSKFILSLLEHEIGHALGHEHSIIASSIMYPIINDAKYAPTNSTYVLDSTKPLFIQACTFNTVSSFHYKVASNGKTPINAYFVDWSHQYGNLKKASEMTPYKERGCHGAGAYNLEGTCDVFSNSGLLIVPEKADSADQTITVFIDELTS